VTDTKSKIIEAFNTMDKKLLKTHGGLIAACVGIPVSKGKVQIDDDWEDVAEEDVVENLA
jgi:hypothetical protein